MKLLSSSPELFEDEDAAAMIQDSEVDGDGLSLFLSVCPQLTPQSHRWTETAS